MIGREAGRKEILVLSSPEGTDETLAEGGVREEGTNLKVVPASIGHWVR